MGLFKNDNAGASGSPGNWPLDLDNDGFLTDADKDGWMYHQGLPYTDKLHPRRIYAPYRYLYYQYQ